MSCEHVFALVQIQQQGLLTHPNTPSFYLSLAHFLTMLCICFNIPHYINTSFTMLMWSYHQWFCYPFITLPMQEWAHCSPRYALRYHCSYHVGKWNSCRKKCFTPFPPPYTKTSWYCYHQRQFSNLGGHCHC